MGETAQIAEIARLVSEEIFKPFGWERSGTSDHSFKGAIPHLPAGEVSADADEIKEDETSVRKEPMKAEEAAPSSALQPKDYPTDVVFFYEDPYSLLRTYIHFDLKSYAAATLKWAKVVGALRSLSRAIAAAELSEDWGNKFAPQQSNYRIHGGLFVYSAELS
jgi:hypothetical protein